jgi:deoxyribodipyrimidine photo-lyase
VKGPRETALVWFRRDLRVHDHPALRAALARRDLVVPVFCLEDRLLHGRHSSGPRAQFLLECLMDLKSSLRELGSDLVIRRGPPERELVELARQVGAGELHFTADVTPFARARGLRVRGALEQQGIELCAHPGLNVVDEVGAIRTRAGKPYTVFSPFYRNWERIGRRIVLGAPRRLPSLPRGVAVGRVPSLDSLGLEQELVDPAPGGERPARLRLKRFLAADVRDYHSSHDALASDRTSRLSPYLHFGCVSPREVERRLPEGAGPDAFRRQLCWRDFYHHVLLRFPACATKEFQERYRGKIKWSYAERRFHAWCEGRTGFPLVDAGMRQLLREGWMHNRARLVVGSFLTKDLGIDWRWGERHFMRLLLDGDEPNNNGNWQWIASVGVDPQPVFKRVLSPTRQMQAHDGDGTYVRRYVPELAQVPDDYICEPWTMPSELQRALGCVIGNDYPAPIVDHAVARRAALERYRLVR